ncbi:MAG: TRAP transporter TatT component family protein [bacterium]
MFTFACTSRPLRVERNTWALSVVTSGSLMTGEVSDDDLPFELRAMAAVLKAVPDNQDLLISAASRFVQFGMADMLLAPTNPESAGRKTHAKQAFLRASEYGLRVLELSHPGFGQALDEDPQQALLQTTHDDVAALYWTGAALSAAISADKSDQALTGVSPVAQALLARARKLDETFGSPAIRAGFSLFQQ